MLDADVTSLITETDAYLDAVIATGTLSATLLQLLSRLYTAWRVMLRDPNSQSLGGYSYDRNTTLRMMKAEFDALVVALGDGGIAFTAASESLGDD